MKCRIRPISEKDLMWECTAHKKRWVGWNNGECIEAVLKKVTKRKRGKIARTGRPRKVKASK